MLHNLVDDLLTHPVHCIENVKMTPNMQLRSSTRSIFYVGHRQIFDIVPPHTHRQTYRQMDTHSLSHMNHNACISIRPGNASDCEFCFSDTYFGTFYLLVFYLCKSLHSFKWNCFRWSGSAGATAGWRMWCRRWSATGLASSSPS